ncbi:DUF3035 domain-containing protein [Plastorhodobacter daqingensis]|uniref:DUF3035 domain-containing protein n=1 Tax=Plastorhodobacter daqingensis TaxID=1387281 RepID=A0ABW2UQU4_9RHOB
MQARARIFGTALMALLGLAACGGGDPRLMNVTSNTRSPDEFAILPTRPLQMPPDLNALPQPTPGGANRVDPQPLADAAAALGGNLGAITGGPAPADGALLAHAQRNGVTSTIRADLAAEDAAFRRSNRGRPLERLFGVNVYYRVYGPQSLDAHAELERWRAAGARTPAAPPRP